MKPGPQSLQRLIMVAGLLRDRDLQAAARSAARLREIDHQFEILDRLQEASRNAARSIAEPTELLLYQAYASHTERRRRALLQEREAHAASAAAVLEEARRSFARANILEALQEASRQQLRRKQLRKGQG
mgnify:CR=1 FL=1